MRTTALALALVAAIGHAEEANWQVAPRTLAPPGGASPVLKDAVAQTPAPSVEQRSAMQPASAQEWRAMIDLLAGQPDLEALAESANVTIGPGDTGGVPTYRVVPKGGARAPHADHLFLYIHGGAYVFGGGDAAVAEAPVIATAAGIAALAIDYRMPPDHPFPAAVDDVVAVYREVLKDHTPTQIAIGGTSAGGGLSLAAIHRMKSLELPVPGAVYLGTPWADLTDTSDSLHTLEGIDRILVTYDGMLAAAAKLYAGDTALTDPLISPVYGDFNGFPPTYLVTGTRDMLLSDTARVHRKLKTAGVVTDLNVYEGLSHGEYAMLVGSPEHQQTYAELAEFLATHLE